jgi:hypothetical protein
MHRVAAAIGAWALLVGGAAAEETWKNWFDDPFFQVRAAVADCPTPRGPFGPEAEMRKEAHARVERGTSCWLAGRCTRPNAYQYDAGIAEAVRQRFAGSGALSRTSLWVTVQRRIAWVEGCASQADAGRRVSQLLRGIPDLDQVIVQIARDPARPVPYPTVPPGSR